MSCICITLLHIAKQMQRKFLYLLTNLFTVTGEEDHTKTQNSSYINVKGEEVLTYFVCYMAQH